MRALLLSLLFTTALISGCSDEERNATIQVWLTDAPGDYQEVNVEIEGVEIHTSDGEEEEGWQSLNTASGVYNLLELTNGLDTLLGSIEIPAGRVSQIRLKLGDNNTLKVNDETYPLNVPSGSQSGLKLQIHQDFAEGVTYKILLDFDVARSIVTTGNGNYKLKPVIRTITEAQSGAIKGIIDPAAATPAIYAIKGQDTVATGYSNDAGQFLLQGVPAGTYTVSVSPNSGYHQVDKTGVSVSLGTVTDLGIVEVDPK